MTAERRELVVAGALVRHQLRVWLDLNDIAYKEHKGLLESSFVVSVVPEQWDAINQWVEKVKQ
jgi:hypothetical protein